MQDFLQLFRMGRDMRSVGSVVETSFAFSELSASWEEKTFWMDVIRGKRNEMVEAVQHQAGGEGGGS